MMWNDNLKIGVPKIDSQHKELCGRLDQLLDACKKGQGNSEILKTLQFLQEYTIRHFGEEENLQLIYGYPKIKEHKAQHEYFKQKIAEFKQLLETQGAGIAVISKTNLFLVDWLINHIQKIDSELAQYIK